MDIRGRRLYRSVGERRVAGVCGGLGDYLEIDPVLVRLIWVALTCVTGVVPGLISYGIAWIIVPEQPIPVPATGNSQEPTPDLS